MSNVLSRRTLIVTTTHFAAKAWIEGVAMKLREEIGAEVHVGMSPAVANTYILVIDSSGEDDADFIIDVACDLRMDLGTAKTEIQVKDSYGEILLGAGYLAD
jgi:hypothetical protein